MKLSEVIQLFAICTVAFFSGCTDEIAELSRFDNYSAGSIVLRLETGEGYNTKTLLTGSYSLHNVRQAYAVLYKGAGEDAEYVCHQDLNWNPRSEADYGDGVVQQTDVEITIPSALVDGKYTILCVGLDDCAGDVYSLNVEGESIPTFCRTGAKLSEAKARLASGKTMKYAELFAGCNSFDYTADQVNKVSVEMRRRVAGIYAYIKDIPMSINGKEISYIRLVSENTPRAEIGLISGLSADGELAADFGNGVQDAEAKVLDIIELSTVASAGDNNLYEIDSEYTERLGLQAGTLLLSSYVIPMDAGEGNTFCIELLDAGQNTVKSFPAIWSMAPGEVDSMQYPVFPDYIYHIGTRDKEGERPVSLAGYRLEIVIQPWTEVGVAFDFPNVPLDASIGYDKNSSLYIYDCINATDELEIYPSLMRKDWRLTIVAEDKNGRIDPDTHCDWLFFKLPDGSGYTQEIYSKDFEGWKETDVKIEILMNDYVEERDMDMAYNSTLPSGREAINTDWRRARIVLQTDESSTPAHLSFRQYNAITIKGQYKYGAIKRDYKCGFSRFDMGVVRDRDGNVTSPGTANGWGFWSSAFFQIHQPFTYDSPDCEPCYNGEVCYTSAKRNEKGFPDSIIDISMCESVEWDGTANLTGDHFWYIPSQLELYSFFNSIARYDDIDAHIEQGALYWSGTAYCDSRILASRVRSYCQRTTEIAEDTYALREGNYGYTRRARKFK